MSNIQRLKAFKKHKSGAYGEVWVGEQVILGRKVALKIIKVEMADEATARDHALALARLNHPNIVTIHNIEPAELPGGQLAEAIVMEWLPGPTFGELLQQGSISKEQLFRIMDASIQGVRHMHLNNVFHGDLHPGNVIVGDTFVKIIDVSATDSKSITRFSTISKDTLIARDVASLAYNLRFGVYRSPL